MAYEIIDNITSADIAVRVKAPTLSLLFTYGAEALVSEMVEDISSIKKSVIKNGLIEGDDLPILYFEFLNGILFFKDAESLLLLPSKIDVTHDNRLYRCSYQLHGDLIDADLHKITADIKAVTLHQLNIYKNKNLFIAESVFDV